MRKVITLLLAAVLLGGGVVGCNSDRDKGVNKNKDKPRSADQ
jgi:hypothetical protein